MLELDLSLCRIFPEHSLLLIHKVAARRSKTPFLPFFIDNSHHYLAALLQSELIQIEG